jgi:uncharacterized protein YdhG (YjbR/CyaY superfamily)
VPPRRAAVPRTVDEYLRGISPDSRAALKRLRTIIRTAAPNAEELLSYGHPAFRQGKMRVNYAAFHDHCSLFGWARVREQFSSELAPFETGRGTLAFTPNRPLPPDLVSRIVKALLALNADPPAGKPSRSDPATDSGWRRVEPVTRRK